MTEFRIHLINLIDRRHQPLHLSSAAHNLIFNSNDEESFNRKLRHPRLYNSKQSVLTIHVVAASVWPAHLLSATVCSSLRLPLELLEIKKEFETFFAMESQSERQESNESSSQNSSQPRRLLLQGATSQHYEINGEYEEMIEYAESSGHVYVSRRDGKWIIEYSLAQRAWQIKARVFKESSSHIAFCKVDTLLIDKIVKPRQKVPSQPPPIGSVSWKEFNGSKNAWDDSSICLTAVDSFDKGSLINLTSVGSLLHGRSERSPTPLRRLIWCHKASTAILTALLHSGLKAFIHASAPQAAIILAFKSSTCSYLSVRALCVITGLSLKEIQKLLISLTNNIAPILRQLNIGSQNNARSASMGTYSTPPRFRSKSLSSYTPSSRASPTPSTTEIGLNDTFAINDDLLKGSLGGLSEAAPIFVVTEGLSIGSNSEFILDSSAGIGRMRSVHSWRNELIDACIVRHLKIAARTANNTLAPLSPPTPVSVVPSECLQSKNLPLDILFDQVRGSLSDQSSLAATAEDVMRRAERLVAAGIINKVGGQRESFRSVAYCYFSDEEDDGPSFPIPATAVVEGDGMTGAQSGQRPNNSSTPSLKRIPNIKDPKQGQDRWGAENRAVGEDLYHYLRITLEIKKLSDNAPGISKQLFLRKFIEWISVTQCSFRQRPSSSLFSNASSFLSSSLFSVPVSFPSLSATSSTIDHPTVQGHSLERLAKLLMDMSGVAKQQLEVLQIQQLEGLRRPGDGLSSPLAPTFPALDCVSEKSFNNDFSDKHEKVCQLEQSNEEKKEEFAGISPATAAFPADERLSQQMDDIASNKRSLDAIKQNKTDEFPLSSSLNLCKVCIKYLPVGVVRILLNAFRAAIGERTLDYEESDEEYSRLYCIDNVVDSSRFIEMARRQVELEIIGFENKCQESNALSLVTLRSRVPQDMWPHLDSLLTYPVRPFGKTAGLPMSFSPVSSVNNTSCKLSTSDQISSVGVKPSYGCLPVSVPSPPCLFSSSSTGFNNQKEFTESESELKSTGSAPRGDSYHKFTYLAGDQPPRHMNSAEYDTGPESRDFGQDQSYQERIEKESLSTEGSVSLSFEQFATAALEASSLFSSPSSSSSSSKSTDSVEKTEGALDAFYTATDFISRSLNDDTSRAMPDPVKWSKRRVSDPLRYNSPPPLGWNIREKDEETTRKIPFVYQISSFRDLLVNGYMGPIRRGIVILFKGHSGSSYILGSESSSEGEEKDASSKERKGRTAFASLGEVVVPSLSSHTQEPMLPCEFCSELVGLSILESHQIECGASRGLIRRVRVLDRGRLPPFHVDETLISPREQEVLDSSDDTVDDEEEEEQEEEGQCVIDNIFLFILTPPVFLLIIPIILILSS
jgi:hypothetical protein